MHNSAFDPKFIESQSEGTYVTDIIIPLLQATLKGLSYKYSFLSTYVFFSITGRMVSNRLQIGHQSGCPIDV